MEPNIIELKNISKSYPCGSGKSLEVLKNISLTVKVGEMTAIIGKSGSGKSTLLNIIGCIDRADIGSYFFCGNDITNQNDKRMASLRGSHISFVFQDYALIEEESVLNNVQTPLYFSKVANLAKMKKTALDAIKAIGISDLSHKKVSLLSGGQKQRVAIARAIVEKPELILADEPTGALDSETSSEILDVLRELNANGTTVIIVTHDMDIAKKCGRILTISDGKINEQS